MKDSHSNETDSVTLEALKNTSQKAHMESQYNSLLRLNDKDTLRLVTHRPPFLSLKNWC